MLCGGSPGRTCVVRATLLDLAVVLALAPAAPTSAAAADPQTSVAIRDAIVELRTRRQVRMGEVTLSSFEVLPRVYETRQYAPLWVDASRVRHMMGAIAASYEEGLDPDTAAELQAKADTLFKGETLRAILLNAYGWWTAATIAEYAGYVMIAAGVLFGIGAFFGFRHANRAAAKEGTVTDIAAAA